MNPSQENLFKFEVVKQIMNTVYDNGGFVDKDYVLMLLKKDLKELKQLLREVKISGVIDENKKRD